MSEVKRVDGKRKERILAPYTPVRAFGRLIMLLVGAITIALMWDITTRIIKF